MFIDTYHFRNYFLCICFGFKFYQGHSFPMRQSNLPIFEYACHEGNYGMDGTLTGARAIENASGQ